MDTPCPAIQGQLQTPPSPRPGSRCLIMHDNQGEISIQIAALQMPLCLHSPGFSHTWSHVLSEASKSLLSGKY